MPCFAQTHANSIDTEPLEPAVKPERELIEIGLQVLRAYPVVRSGKPAFQVRKYKVNHREIILGNLGLVALDNGKVLVALGGKRGVTRGTILTTIVPGSTAASTKPTRALALRLGIASKRSRPA